MEYMTQAKDHMEKSKKTLVYSGPSSSSQLVCLNLSNNRLYKLDDLADLVAKVPNLKILNLSHNDVWSFVFNYVQSCSVFLVHVVTSLFVADKVGERVGQAEGAEAGGVVIAEEPSVRSL